MSRYTREVSYRMFSYELNNSKLEIKGEDEKSPTYIITPLGTQVNRVLMAGALVEKDNVGSEEEPMWRASVQDYAGGVFYINVGRFQPLSVTTIMDKLEAPTRIAVVGKVKTYTNQEGRMFVSIRPENIVEIDDATWKVLQLDTARSTWDRMNRYLQVARIGFDADDSEFTAQGIDKAEVDNFYRAYETYGTPDSNALLKTIQSALRVLLPNDNVDFGLPGEELDDGQLDIDGDEIGPASVSDIAETIYNMLIELDDGVNGASKTKLEDRCEEEGISTMDMEAALSQLENEGRLYQPNGRVYKPIS